MAAEEAPIVRAEIGRAVELREVVIRRKRQCRHEINGGDANSGQDGRDELDTALAVHKDVRRDQENADQQRQRQVRADDRRISERGRHDASAPFGDPPCRSTMSGCLARTWSSLSQITP